MSLNYSVRILPPDVIGFDCRYLKSAFIDPPGLLVNIYKARSNLKGISEIVRLDR